MLPLGPVGDSAVLVWPVVERPITLSTGETRTEYVVDRPLVKPEFVSIYELGPWEAEEIKVRSPAWMKRYGGSRATADRQCWIKEGDRMELKRLSAKMGFWMLCLAFLQGLAKYLGMPFHYSDSEFTLVFHLCKFIEPLWTDMEVLEIALRRLKQMRHRKTDEITEYLKVDETADFLDKDDVKELKSKVNQNKSEKENRSNFRNDMKAKRHQIAAAGGGNSRHLLGGAREPVPDGKEIPQPVVKKLAPPFTLVWASRSDRSWQARSPCGLWSRGWDKYSTQRGAAWQLLKELWEEFLEDHGFTNAECPVPGLLTPLPAAAGPSVAPELRAMPEAVEVPAPARRGRLGGRGRGGGGASGSGAGVGGGAGGSAQKRRRR